MAELFAGRYEPLEVIGKGATGSVWRVLDHREGRVIAAKLLRQSDKTSLLRFVMEQAIRIHHPHVLSPLGWAAESDRVILTMPLADGGSLASLMADVGALPPRFVAEVLRQLLCALAAVHQAKVVHRDVSPANLLLRATGTQRPHVFLSDFGIAAHLDGPHLLRNEAMSGTPGFAAPEQIGGGDPTPQGDIYSAGQVARQLLTGWPPNSHRSATPPTGAPPSLWYLIEDLTNADPTLRPSIPQALARLEASELAWSPEAIGVVDVVAKVAAEHIPDHVADTEDTPLAPSMIPPAARSGRLRRLLAVFAMAVLIVIIATVLGLLTWRSF